MYKRFTLNELKTVQNNFIPNFFSIIKKERCVFPLDFFKKVFKDGESIYYLNRGEAIFRASQEKEIIRIVDEKEKIEIILNENDVKELQSIIKSYIIKKERIQGQKSIEQILLHEFQGGLYNTILGKPYLVYDIETTSNMANLKEVKFLLAYSMEPKADNTMDYEYIDQNDLPKFVQKLVDFDGYIVGFNNIGFDNPVCIYNVGGKQEDLEKINSKSLDIFLFIQALTHKRISLNKISTALIGIEKTLESGKEVEVLRRKYQETGDKKFMEEFKKYCKNDVRMTALVLLYLLHFQKIFVEGGEISFGINDLIEKSHTEIQESKNENGNQVSIFG